MNHMPSFSFVLSNQHKTLLRNYVCEPATNLEGKTAWIKVRSQSKKKRYFNFLLERKQSFSWKMGVLKRFFMCNADNCKYEWSSIAYQMEEQQCPKCTKIAQYYKTKQKMKNGSLVGTYECAGKNFNIFVFNYELFLKGRKGKTCGRTWKSAVAFKGSWQMCTRCQTKCFPVHVIGMKFYSLGH